MKNGYTLVELLTVIAIIGILSSMGYVNFHEAVANHRTRDAALNIAAFMEQVANRTRQMNTELCVRRDDAQKLIVLKSKCAAANESSERVDSLMINSPVKILATTDNDFRGPNFASTDAQFEPRIGLSCSPYEGYIKVQYGDMDLFGIARKTKTKNYYTSMIKYSGSSSWSDL